jgi:hypothetical protein
LPGATKYGCLGVYSTRQCVRHDVVLGKTTAL